MKPIKPDVANLSVTTHGSVSWNDERMGDEQLAQRLQASAPRQPQPEDFIRGDRLVGPPARRPGVGGYAEVRVLKLSFVTDPGSDRGEPKDTLMKLHRHARPDAGVSSSAAPIANSDTRERLRAVLGTPADLPALRTQHRLRGPGSQERLRHIAWPPALAWQQQTWPSAFSVRLCAPASSARVGDGLPTGMSASTRCNRRRC
ncbi:MULTISPECIES: hypothetical protein [Achromobacter]|uniref:ExbD/TolR family protein n=1 Tax=Achromobacter TaxID=222 RepID=UPI000B4CC96B|nr:MULTISPECIES: hypothetical protein [Achromobacter]ASC65449.1 hypothetical protein B9P52_14570 [Achromobacter denitrificans]MDH1301604.1 hypothetical protein [Achromobacter sp. GD03932]HBO7069360.1 hypothetical protein [Pseudomonas aeruginosa]